MNLHKPLEPGLGPMAFKRQRKTCSHQLSFYLSSTSIPLLTILLHSLPHMVPWLRSSTWCLICVCEQLLGMWWKWGQGESGWEHWLFFLSWPLHPKRGLSTRKINTLFMLTSQKNFTATSMFITHVCSNYIEALLLDSGLTNPTCLLADGKSAAETKECQSSVALHIRETSAQVIRQ